MTEFSRGLLCASIILGALFTLYVLLQQDCVPASEVDGIIQQAIMGE